MSNEWPIPKFHFLVKIGDSEMMFQEVSGLEAVSQDIEYRRGDSPDFSNVKMPGIKKFGNVTMKKGVFVKDNKFFEWMARIKDRNAGREKVTIRLLDESGSVTMTWTLTGAFPVKVSSTDLKADGNEVAVETLELSHEGLTVS